MELVVEQADIVGVLGLWRPPLEDDPLTRDAAAKTMTALRGTVGHWRGVDLMLRRARETGFEGQIPVTQHLYFYFGVARNVDRLIAAASRTICLTNRGMVVERLRARNPGASIDWIPVGATTPGRVHLTAPDFIGTTEVALPQDLTGCLCLVGTGVWAEGYCTTIKRRGGVAVDLGSGFDLLDGRLSRPTHRMVPAHVVEELLPEGASIEE
ncbi:hypothetical protein [Breoghania sp.]|uniref:hypothetical protein n=1 Tax=Breoghania sp. TaxID=2065378 RepID=UPI00261B1AF7|nr:hypothetical protein [Breoghania sp.]